MWGVELGYRVRAVGFGVGLNSLGSVCRVRGCRAKGLELYNSIISAVTC